MFCGLPLVCLPAKVAQAQGLIEFVQPNCPACRQIEPTVERLELAGVRVVRCRASAADPVCRTLGIRTTPTFIAVDRSGHEVDRIVGAPAEADLKDLAGEPMAG